jgi:hypothetical protein
VGPMCLDHVNAVSEVDGINVNPFAEPRPSRTLSFTPIGAPVCLKSSSMNFVMSKHYDECEAERDDP